MPPPAAATLAYDARNALAAARGRLQLAQRASARDEADPAAVRAHLDRAADCLGSLAALIDALEATGRPARRRPLGCE